MLESPALLHWRWKNETPASRKSTSPVMVAGSRSSLKDNHK